jgi:O-antigen/teichoic acid export membrane protein
MEITIPVTRALFPVFARIKDDVRAMRAAYLDVFGAAAIMSVAVGGGMSLVAHDFTVVVLGTKWLQAVPLVRILSISGALYGIMHAGIPVMTATGHARLSAQITTSRAIGTVLAAGLAAAVFGDMISVAVARTVITLVFIPGIFLQLSRVLPVTVEDMLGRLGRPLASGAIMAAVVLAVHGAMPPVPWLRLLADSFVGAVAYTTSVPALWLLAGRPAGLEATVLRKLAARLPARWRVARIRPAAADVAKS